MTEQFKVLVVDDDDTLLQLLTETVQTMGCFATSARSGLDALNLISVRKFDIVVTDLKMPGMDGLKLLEEIKKIDRDVVVIMVTGYATLETAVKAIEKGAYDYIAKPFRLDELMVVIKNACERLRLLKQKNALLDELKGAYTEIDRLKKVATAPSEGDAANNQDNPLEAIDFESFKRRNYSQPIDIETARKKYFSDI
ncbi:hypothetical protein MNBD_DELTA01-334 [hydrothermal vent metagenome]|uniref:Response regulatory domain-containing protein n=1 Tax=hydrothermal vent metagenome TaxID=652676 RepID=A0A3B0QVM6_9ZZZZ